MDLEEIIQYIKKYKANDEKIEISSNNPLWLSIID